MPTVILATAGYDQRILFWEAPSARVLREVPYPDSQVNCLAITPDKRHLAVGGNPNLRLFYTEGQSSDDSPITSFEGHTDNIVSIGFQNDCKWMFSASEDGTVKIWDMRVPGCHREYSVKQRITCASLHPNEAEIVVGDDQGYVHIIDLIKDQVVHSFEPIPTFDEDQSVKGKRQSISNSSTVPWESVVKKSNLTDLSKYSSFVQAAKASKNDLPQYDLGRELKLQMIKNGTYNEDINSIYMKPHSNPDDDVLPSTSSTTSQSEDGRVKHVQKSMPLNKLINLKTVKKNIRPAQVLFSVGERSIRSIFCSHDGKFFVVGTSGGTCHFYDLQKWTQTRNSLQAHHDYILKCRISPNNRYLATTSADHTVKLWDIKNNYSLKTTLGVTKSQKEDEKLRGVVERHPGHSRWVWDCVFSADAAYLISASSDSTALLWDTQTSKTVQTYAKHTKAVTCIALHDTET